ncbi:hypothetical protein [Mangrovihabitans endophyticus]|uniref:Uncharacterized protein n=1 Tax=Mangrovihabitans endophyticus TaxID=1751298 RepID=A0A8J3C772_9ACTN|nr:hypothetical protein [Mangrovihabitans endophyticus]GGL17745.1 hypothetical protein GCM10012284_60430 [Mangrovihabitans endophyticus]
MSHDTTAAEVVGLDQSIAYAEGLAAEAGEHGTDGGETYLAHLAERRVVGAGLTTATDMQEAFTTAAAAAAAHAAELTKQKSVQEAYDAAPDAGDKDFQLGADSGAGQATPASTATSTEGTPVNDDDSDDPRQPAGRTEGGYHRCTNCGYVADRGEQPPRRCWNCGTVDGQWTPAETFFPDRPSDDAVAADTRDVETEIRNAYARLAHQYGDGVSLTDLRAALPEGLDRAAVDAALYKLAAHSDVSLTPRTDQKLADDETQRTALATGASYAHTLRIHRNRSMLDTAQRIHMADRRTAESMLAPLSDRDVAYLAERMDVDTNGTTEQLRERIADRADRNREEWLADARQGADDGTLLYRADNEPEWVATWTEEDRQKAAAAAARLQHRAATEERWAYVKDRADRWANPQPAATTGS